jgi:hypothetical protein
LDRGDKIVAWILTVFAVAMYAALAIRFRGQWGALIGGGAFIYVFLRTEVWKKR